MKIAFIDLLVLRQKFLHKKDIDWGHKMSFFCTQTMDDLKESSINLWKTSLISFSNLSVKLVINQANLSGEPYMPRISSYHCHSIKRRLFIWDGLVRTSSIFRSDTPTHPQRHPGIFFPWGRKLLTTTDEQRRQTDTMQVQHIHENFQNCCHMRVTDVIVTIERI